MFSREIKHTHYRAPRSIEQAFGPYSRFEAVVRHPIMRDLAERLGYIVAGLILGGGIIAPIMIGLYEALCWAVKQ